MTNREKIFLGLTAAGALGAAVYYALPSSGGKSNEPKAKDFSALIAQVQVNLQQTDLTAREEQVLVAAVAPAPRDPLSPQPLQSSGNTTGVPLPRYTGFINTGPKPIAIIDGRDYRPGDSLRGGEFQVVKIFPDRIELRRRGASDPVRIPLEVVAVPAATR